MKAEEAKKKWCPMVRFTMTPSNQRWQNSLLSNRLEDVQQGHVESCCIATDCMMWRPDNPCVPDEGRCGMMHPYVLSAEVRNG